MASKAEKFPLSGQQPRLTASGVERAVSLAVLLSVVSAIAFGWLHRKGELLNPEHGFGYALGIIGGTMMILLLAYPLRKRVRMPSKKAGSVGFWFRFHMLLGLLGPLAILYHSRFTWGALNSAFALGAMLVVATSGLVGRFFYSRVHRGYSDRKLEIRALKREMDGLLAELAASGLARDEVFERLQPFEDRAVAAGGSFWSSAGAVIGMGVESRFAERRIARSLARAAGTRGMAARSALAHYFKAVRRAAEFAFYDRLLRLWHLFHLPLFILMVGAAVLHIVAVHMY